jgi:hypothetical protein
MTDMKPEDTMPKPADDVLWNPVESPVTGETDAAEDEEEMPGDGLPPVGFPH